MYGIVFPGDKPLVAYSIPSGHYMYSEYSICIFNNTRKEAMHFRESMRRVAGRKGSDGNLAIKL